MSGEAGEYTTLLYPFDIFEDRIPDSFLGEGGMTAQGWTIRTRRGEKIESIGFSSNARLVLEHSSGAFLLSATRIENGGQQLKLTDRNDFYVEYGPSGSAKVTFLGHHPAEISLGSGAGKYEQIQPGSNIVLQ